MDLNDGSIVVSRSAADKVPRFRRDSHGIFGVKLGFRGESVDEGNPLQGKPIEDRNPVQAAV